MENLIIIEERDNDGTNYIISFNGSNPEEKDSYACRSMNDAKRLKALINDYVMKNSPNRAE